MKKNILIHSSTILPISQTFIHRQIDGIAEKFGVVLLAEKFANPDIFAYRRDLKTRDILKSINGLNRISHQISLKVNKPAAPYSRGIKKYIKEILEEDNIQLIHSHFGPNAIKILEVAKLSGKPLMVSFHGYDASTLIKHRKYLNQLKPVFDYAKKIILVSPHMIENLQISLANQSKVEIVPYGINTDFFLGEDGVRAMKPTVDILHVGRLTNKKGVPDLIRAFAEVSGKYPDVRLHIVGAGEEESVCVDLVREKKLDSRVTFYGAQTQEFIKKKMASCDVFVLNSRVADDGDMEGLPNTILEALSMEMAVISTDHAGIPLAIKNNENGLLIPEKDNKSLSDALVKLVTNKELRLQLGKSGRVAVLKSFTQESMCSTINRVYEECLG
jgi:colanic acid/amylovoran biosynthesis glycosyltransferase